MQEKDPTNHKKHTKKKKNGGKDQHKNNGVPWVRRMKNTTGNIIFITNIVHPTIWPS